MRIVFVGVLAVVLPALPAQAGWLGTGGGNLPKPALFTDQRNSDAHKMAVHVRKLNSKYNSPTWGALGKIVGKQQVRPFKSLR